MRILMLGLAAFVVSSSAVAQPPAAPGASPAAARTMVSAADVTALIAKAKADRKDNQPIVAQSLIQLAPYNVSLEYRASVGNAAVHDTEAELFYVVEGSATLVTGGKLTNETRPNAENITGSGIEGGVSRQRRERRLHHGARKDRALVQRNRRHDRPDVAAPAAQTAAVADIAGVASPPRAA